VWSFFFVQMMGKLNPDIGALRTQGYWSFTQWGIQVEYQHSCLFLLREKTSPQRNRFPCAAIVRPQMRVPQKRVYR